MCYFYSVTDNVTRQAATQVPAVTSDTAAGCVRCVLGNWRSVHFDTRPQTGVPARAQPGGRPKQVPPEGRDEAR